MKDSRNYISTKSNLPSREKEFRKAAGDKINNVMGHDAREFKNKIDY